MALIQVQFKGIPAQFSILLIIKRVVIHSGETGDSDGDFCLNGLCFYST